MFLEFLGSVFGFFSIEIFFAVCVFAVIAAFIVCLFLSVFKIGYGLKKRAWYPVFVALFCAILNARANIVGGKDFSSLLCALGLALFIPVFFVRVKPREDKSEEVSRREFVRFLDGKIKEDKENAFRQTGVEPPINAEPVETLKAERTEEEISDGLDFSHVKNVLQRLEPAALSYSDRRQIRDLELSLYEAERGDRSPELKSKINEGLGNLLKIMAKHGV